MFNFSFRSDIDRALSKLETVRKEIEQKAVPRALNKTIDSVRARAPQEIRAVGYRFKASSIRDALSVIKANASANSAILRASRKPTRIYEFSARQTKTGVTVSVKNGRKLLKGAFIATMPSGHTGVYRRTGAARESNAHKKIIKNGRISWSGLPIDEIYSVSVGAAFNNGRVMHALNRRAREVFPKFFDHEISRIKK